MSDTYRYFPDKTFRCPKGRKKAIINNVRKKAIPPDPWEDIGFDDESLKPWKILEKLIKNGKDDEYIFNKLKKKFHLSSDKILYMIRCYKK